MRTIALMMVAVLAAASPAAASWKEYPQPQLGFVVEFPSDPASTTGNYKTTLVPSATAHIYSVKDDESVFLATVVDLLDRKEEGATLLGEAESMVRQLGDVTSVSASRVEPGRAAVFGRFITIVCRSGHVPDLLGQTADSVRAWFKNITGAECRGSKPAYGQHVLPSRPALHDSGDQSSDGRHAVSGPALRFANSISFFAADGTRNFADTFK